MCFIVHKTTSELEHVIVTTLYLTGAKNTDMSHVCLLSTRNHAFAKFMMQVITLKVNYPKYSIKSIRMDNAAEFSSRAFNNYCMTQGIEVQHSVPYIHTQNGLAESLIKRIRLIAKSLIKFSHNRF